MRKFLLSIAAVFMLYSAQAQETEETEVPKSWTSKGNFALIANQSSFSNWQAGGDNNLAGNVNLNYDLNYKKDDWTWDNKFQVSYGLTKLKGEKEKKTDDRLEFTSLLGKQMTNKWYYSLFMNFKTQMDSGWDEDGNKNTHFMSPAYLQIGPGLLWKDSDNLKVNFAPATSRFIMVHKHFTEFGDAFGVEQGKTMEYQLGMAINGYYKFNPMENVSIENILNLYSNYLEKPENIIMDYQLNVVLKVNKYLSTNLTFQAIYDDKAYQGFQLREMIGLGVNYTF
ncbi:DUF3078 domain-containing protein [Myroides sp. DW712]|uniref:DUF3078 domain-containing protein n=1 Tax=Myroides sp. DW712 TaxID=3389800 RepID=UPI00397E2002